MVKHEMAEVWSGIDARLREYEEKLARQDPSRQSRDVILYSGAPQDNSQPTHPAAGKVKLTLPRPSAHRRPSDATFARRTYRRTTTGCISSTGPTSCTVTQNPASQPST